MVIPSPFPADEGEGKSLARAVPCPLTPFKLWTFENNCNSNKQYLRQRKRYDERSRRPRWLNLFAYFCFSEKDCGARAAEHEETCKSVNHLDKNQRHGRLIEP
jgi:hypothetical protein